MALRRAVQQQWGGGGHLNEWLPLSSAISWRRKFAGSIVCGDSGVGTMSWQFEIESKRDHQGEKRGFSTLHLIFVSSLISRCLWCAAIALDYILHALDLLDEHLSLCHDVSTESDLSSSASENPTRQPMSSARLHYVAARLLMSLDDPTGASVHLKIASAQTKSWPSLHLSIQRALSTCTERYVKEITGPNPLSNLIVANIVLPDTTDLQNSCIELLLWPDSCKLLSHEERMEMQMRVWPAVSFNKTKLSLTKTQYKKRRNTFPTQLIFLQIVNFFIPTQA